MKHLICRYLGIQCVFLTILRRAGITMTNVYGLDHNWSPITIGESTVCQKLNYHSWVCAFFGASGLCEWCSGLGWRCGSVCVPFVWTRSCYSKCRWGSPSVEWWHWRVGPRLNPLPRCCSRWHGACAPGLIGSPSTTHWCPSVSRCDCCSEIQIFLWITAKIQIVCWGLTDCVNIFRWFTIY